MPFVPQTPKPFNRREVLSLNPGQPGVYGIFRHDRWVYVGQSDDIRSRLMEHLNGDNTCIVRQQPTHFVTELVRNSAQRTVREKQLILELRPVCNRRVG